MIRPRLHNPLRYQDFYVGLAVGLVGVLGLLDIAYGNWREGPALGPHAFPQLAYIALIFAGLGIALDVCLGRADPRFNNPRATPIAGVMLVAEGAITGAAGGAPGQGSRPSPGPQWQNNGVRVVSNQQSAFTHGSRMSADALAADGAGAQRRTSAG